VIYQAMLWGINPFDQWAVELGKSIARDVETALRAPASAHGLDGSTALLLSAIHSNS
jgi:glucose-6-phosphate isomerase